jgi:hypothetical protein
MSTEVTDPVCGMQVDPPNSAGSFEFEGTQLRPAIRCALRQDLESRARAACRQET